VEPKESFGDSRLERRWLKPSTREEAIETITAKYLSEVCREVDRVLRQRSWRRKRLAELIGEDPHVVRRKLNGEYPASLTDALRWAIALDHVEVIAAPGSVSELFPPDLGPALQRLLAGASEPGGPPEAGS
jgi:hypothetical protein